MVLIAIMHVPSSLNFVKDLVDYLQAGLPKGAAGCGASAQRPGIA